MALRATLVAACIYLGVFHVVIASDDSAFAELGLAQTLDAQDEEIRLLAGRHSAVDQAGRLSERPLSPSPEGDASLQGWQGVKRRRR